MHFNIGVIENALKFVMYSDDNSIEIIYDGDYKQLVLKSGRLYAAVMPVKKNNVA